MPILTVSDLDVTLQASEGQELHQLSEDNGYPIPMGCYDGHCAACMVRVLDGMQSLAAPTVFERYTLTQAELDDGVRLACQLHMGEGDLVVELY